MKKLFSALLLLLASSFVFAASNSSPGLYYGQVPTAGQWNSYFATKLDYTAGSVNTIPYWDGTGNLLNAGISGDCTSVANVFSCANVGSVTPGAGVFTTLKAVNSYVVVVGRAVNIGTTSDTLAASKATTFESANTGSGAFTVTLAAPVADGERRRICFKNVTGTITWTVTSPATATSGFPTTIAAGQCLEMIYNSIAGSPTNSAATTWYVY
jgi:hypothetical protein